MKEKLLYLRDKKFTGLDEITKLMIEMLLDLDKRIDVLKECIVNETPKVVTEKPKKKARVTNDL